MSIRALTRAPRGLLASLALCALTAHADCVDTVRLNAAELEFYTRANAVLKSLLPPAPVAEALWSGDTSANPADINVCKGEKKAGDFTVTVQRKYVWPDPAKRMSDRVSTLTLAINVSAFTFGDGDFSGVYGSPSPARSAGLKVNNVVWNVSSVRELNAESLRASESLKASVAAAVDRARLQGLVGHSLPSVAESVAAAKKSPPTPLVTAARAAPAAAPGPGPSAEPPSGATPAPATAVTQAAPPPANDAVKDALDTVNKLRGLFSR